ncbi:hypothetical protein D3C71_2022240 [compost metagenome]
MLAERAVKLFARQAGFFRQFTHPFRTSHYANCLGDIARITGFQCISHELCDGLRGGEVLGRIELKKHFSHFASSTNAEFDGRS